MNSPSQILRKVPALRRSRSRRLAATGLLWSGIGAAAVKFIHSIRSRHARKAKGSVTYNTVSEFPGWVDSLYAECCKKYRLIGRRDRVMLDIRFPPESNGLTRGIVSRGADNLGWFVTIDHVYNKENHLGDLKVGLIADFLGDPKDALQIVWAATDYLRSMGVDLIVCNAGHEAWCGALKQNGFLQGPTNFPFLGNAKLIKRLQPFPDFLGQAHFTRGDGDGVCDFLERPQKTSL